jgi:hypothetical protein
MRRENGNVPSGKTGNKFDEEYKRPKFNLATFLGDLAGVIIHFVVNPNSLYFLVLFLAGILLVLDAIPYINLFSNAIHSLASSLDSVPFIRWALSAGIYVIATVVGVILMLVTDVLEIIPVAPRLIIQWGERLYFKVNRQRFETPYEGENAPSVIPKAYRWVRTAVEKNHEVGFLISCGFYLFNFWVAQNTYPVWDEVGSLIVQNAVFVALLVFGFTGCLFVAAIFNSHRLNGAEEAEFQAMKEQLMPPRYTNKN